MASLTDFFIALKDNPAFHTEIEARILETVTTDKQMQAPDRRRFLELGLEYFRNNCDTHVAPGLKELMISKQAPDIEFFRNTPSALDLDPRFRRRHYLVYGLIMEKKKATHRKPGNNNDLDLSDDVNEEDLSDDSNEEDLSDDSNEEDYNRAKSKWEQDQAEDNVDTDVDDVDMDISDQRSDCSEDFDVLMYEEDDPDIDADDDDLENITADIAERRSSFRSWTDDTVLLYIGSASSWDSGCNGRISQYIEGKTSAFAKNMKAAAKRGFLIQHVGVLAALPKPEAEHHYSTRRWILALEALFTWTFTAVHKGEFTDPESHYMRHMCHWRLEDLEWKGLGSVSPLRESPEQLVWAPGEKVQTELEKIDRLKNHKKRASTAFRSSDFGKQWLKDYRASEKGRAAIREAGARYRANPKAQEKAKARNSTQHAKDTRKAYAATEAGKESKRKGSIKWFSKPESKLIRAAWERTPEVKARRKKYRQTEGAKQNAYEAQKRHRENNREKIREYGREYAKKNREKIRERKAKARAKKRAEKEKLKATT